MLLDVTGGQLDILATDLQSELAKPLGSIDRSYPGFGDFAMLGHRAIEPGQPDYSLLYHALAAPSVLTGRNGAPPLQRSPNSMRLRATSTQPDRYRWTHCAHNPARRNWGS
jgi:hypothetical protein